MTTLMLVIIPKGSGAGFAGRPLKNLIGGTLQVKDGEALPVDKTIFDNLSVDDFVIVDNKEYKVLKVSMTTPQLGRVVLEPVE